ncbi:cAMP-dependent protein kinase type II-beta regulatory subunit, partial [Cichlidogyrus casuarinus]
RFLSKAGRRQSVAAESFDPEKIDYSQIKVYEKSDEQKARLNEAIEDIFIFRSLEKDQHSRLIDAMFERTVEKDETVIKQGDDGDNFYIIEKGIFDIIKDDQKVASYDNRGSFGELALMYNCPRAATIIAKSEGILWAMDRESFLKIVLHAAFKKRRMYEELLAACEILKPLSDYERTNLADALTSRDYEDGEEDGMEKELRRIEKDGFFGELALLTDGHRNATIKAVKDVRLAVLDRSSFERLLGPCFDLMKGQSKAYMEDIVQRLGKEAVSQYPSLVKLLGLEDNHSEEAANPDSQNV